MESRPEKEPMSELKAEQSSSTSELMPASSLKPLQVSEKVDSGRKDSGETSVGSYREGAGGVSSYFDKGWERYVLTGRDAGRASGSESCDASIQNQRPALVKGGQLPPISENIKDLLSTFRQTFVVSDATKPDIPIMYASEGFYHMTGYTADEVIGRNCRFLQGPKTDPADIEKIRSAVREGRSFCGRILNYRKDGSTFWNLLTIAPVKSEGGVVARFIGMQVEVTNVTDGEPGDKIRPNGMPTSLIHYDARAQDRVAPVFTELMSAVKRPHPLLELTKNPPKQQEEAGGLAKLLSLPPAVTPPAQELLVLPKAAGENTPESKKHRHNWAEEDMIKEGVEVNFGDQGGSGGEDHGKKKNLFSLLHFHHHNHHNDERHRGFFSRRPLNLTRSVDFPDKRKRSLVAHAKSVDVPDKRVPAKRAPPPADQEPRDASSTDSNASADSDRVKEMRRGLDLATTLERIPKNFVITDPRLEENPIIFASDSFLELTEYSREEVLGRNCRFLQGPDTDKESVKKIREAIDQQKEITVQFLNYTKSGKPFWNLFHLQPVKDEKGELQYFIGVQLDASLQAEKEMGLGGERLQETRLSENTAEKGAKIVEDAARNIDEAVHHLTDANLNPRDLWMIHNLTVLAKPHKNNDALWDAVRKVQGEKGSLRLRNFKPIRPLGAGDTGNVHLVELVGTGCRFAMKAMEKEAMVRRNKVHRACMEREIMAVMDHPFLPTLYASFQTATHVCLITDYCPAGELYSLLERQPGKVFPEEAARFYASEIVLALEYLHYKGVIYRDLKPENVLLQANGHLILTDFDLSFLTSSDPVVIRQKLNVSKRSGRRSGSFRSMREQEGPPEVVALPSSTSNSFVGTEEYIAPEIINGSGHSSAVDWWAFGVLLYEMLYGKTPFRGKNRQRTFSNILGKELHFPEHPEVSEAAKDLMSAVLVREPEERLGSKRGSNELKEHPFFSGINWPLIRSQKPPEHVSPLVIAKDEPPEADMDWDERESGTPR
uniref:non-specific serine/threonine protein kinase n=1 Tax=Coleochaete irregularis TaxID=187194 RepID=A0A059UK01_COLIR|nr:phototropin [Coleochaete irregularis]